MLLLTLRRFLVLEDTLDSNNFSVEVNDRLQADHEADSYRRESNCCNRPNPLIIDEHCRANYRKKKSDKDEGTVAKLGQLPLILLDKGSENEIAHR